MDPYKKMTKKFDKKSASKVINRQYFHRKTGHKCLLSALGHFNLLFNLNIPLLQVLLVSEIVC